MKICINVGHTLSGYGTGANGIKNESVENRKVATILERLLKEKNHEVIISKVDKAKSVSEYLKKCTDIANNSNAELCISIHFNAFNTLAQGVECYYYQGNDKGRKLASRICEEIERLGYKNRGAKDGSHLHMLKNTSMTAVLVECMFIDNKEDVYRYDEEEMARAICDGVLGGSERVYRVCVGSFKSRENATKAMINAKNLGFDDSYIIFK